MKLSEDSSRRAAPSGPPLGPARASKYAPSGPKGAVWVVDDSRLEAERVQRLLSKDYNVEVFGEGGAMLERMSEGTSPDLILLDWQMPGVSGLEVCRFLREKHDEVLVPILMLTTRGSKEDFAEGLSAGANDYVAKPYDDAELLARVRTLVRTRQQAAHLLAREQWFSTTLESIGDAVITVDASGVVTFVNRVAQQLTGWTFADAVGAPFSNVFHVLDEGTRHPIEDPLKGFIRGKGPIPTSLSAILVRKDGIEVPIEDSVAPIGENAAGGSVVVFRDITNRKKSEAEARDRADFEEKLIGIVSHDLRNPLSAILLGAGVLLGREDLGDRAMRTALRIRSSAERASRLVGDLLDFTQARLGSGIPIHPKAIDLHDVINQVLEEVQAAHPEVEVRLETSGDGSGRWDSDRIAQVVSNLVSNAVHHGAPDKPVTVRTRSEKDWAILEVHNCGTPIAPEIMSVLFNAMQRGSADNSHRSMGLGLYIVKHIVDAHRGHITVTSSAAEGTTFELRLPKQAPPSQPLLGA